MYLLNGEPLPAGVEFVCRGRLASDDAHTMGDLLTGDLVVAGSLPVQVGWDGGTYAADDVIATGVRVRSRLCI